MLWFCPRLQILVCFSECTLFTRLCLAAALGHMHKEPAAEWGCVGATGPPGNLGGLSSQRLAGALLAAVVSAVWALVFCLPPSPSPATP